MLKITKTKNRSSERGNVLFLILIAVALFAALSYAVTQSTRTGGKDASSETTLVNSAQITQYPAAIKTAMIRMIISDGVTPDLMEFDPPADFGSLSSNSYGVFHPVGGGAPYQTSPADVMGSLTQGTWMFNSAYQITNIGTTGGTNGASDVIAFLPGIKAGICQKINSELGIGTTDDDDGNGIPDAGIAIANIPTVAMNQDGGNLGIETYDAALVIDGPDVVGQPYGCIDFDDATPATANGDLVYYHVVVER